MDNKEPNHSRAAGALVLAVAALIFLNNNNDVYGYLKEFLDQTIERSKGKEVVNDFRLTVDGQPFGCGVYFKYVGSEELTDVNTVTRIRLANGRHLDFRQHWPRWRAGEAKRIEMPVGCNALVREILSGTASRGPKKVKLYAAFSKKQV
jgi:hypothetical protein